jgi:hypothetical protein
MSFSDFTPNADNANTGGDYTPIPEGIYDLVLDKAELKRTKANDEMLSLVFAVNSGEYADRKIFTNLLMTHNNPDVVSIAKKQLDALIILAKVKFDGTTDCLEGKTLKTKVSVKARKDTGALQNEVLLALPKDGEQTTEAAPAKPSTRPVAAPKAAW